MRATKPAHPPLIFYVGVLGRSSHVGTVGVAGDYAEVIGVPRKTSNVDVFKKPQQNPTTSQPVNPQP